MVASVNGTLYVAQPFDMGNEVDHLTRGAWELDTLQHASETVASKLRRPLEPMPLVIGEEQPAGEHAELINRMRLHMHDALTIVSGAQFEELLDKVEADPSSQKPSSLVEDGVGA